MRRHLANAASGVLDYAAYPIAMLFAAPVMIRSMGAAQYGVWIAAMATLNVGATLAAGFCDANIQRVSALRQSSQNAELVDAVRASMGIHLCLGVVSALICWAVAEPMAAHLQIGTAALTEQAIHCFRVLSVMIVFRAMESVFISTLRAFERFGRAIRISAVLRTMSVLLAAILAYQGIQVARVVDAMAIVLCLSLCVQWMDTRRFLGIPSLAPTANLQAYLRIASFGIYSWLLAAGTVMFTQTDRLLTGATLGAVSLASYGLCVQLSQPIYGALASGLQFVFPHLAQIHVSAPAATPRVVKRALVANGVASVFAVGGVLLFGLWFLKHSVHSDAGAQAARMLPMIAAGSGLASCSITGYYVLLALGRIRYAACVSILAGGVTLLLLRGLAPSFGTNGVIAARFAYGSIMLLLYIPVALHVAKQRRVRRMSNAPAMSWEEA